MQKTLFPLLIAAACQQGFAQNDNNSVKDSLQTNELESVSVKGKKAMGGKVRTQSILKDEATLHETPRSASLLDAKSLQEKNLTTVNETFDYALGFARNTNVAGGYHFYARGNRMTPTDTRVDGFGGINGGGDFSASLFGIDQVVLLRGPAGLLYGKSGSPGGLVNLITKKPVHKEFGEVSVKLGPWHTSQAGQNADAVYGVDYDAGGSISRDGRILYRTTLTHSNSGSITANAGTEELGFMSSLTLLLDKSGDHRLTPQVQYIRDDRKYGDGLVVAPHTSLSTKDGNSFVNLKGMSPLWINLYQGGRVDEQFVAGFDWSSQLPANMEWNLSYRFRAYDTDMNVFQPVASTLKWDAKANAYTIQRAQTKTITDRWNHGLDFNLGKEFVVENLLRNKTMMGANLWRSGTDRSATATGANQSALNLSTGSAAALVDSNLTLKDAFTTDTRSWNSYLSNQTALSWNGREQLILSVSLGYALEKNDRDYSRTGIDPDTVKGLVQITDWRYGKPTPNVGLLWNVLPEWALYGSYSTSYALVDGSYQDKNGETGNFEPETGMSYETGIKYDAQNGKWSAALALFQSNRTDVLVQSATTDLNSNGVRYYVQKDDEGRQSKGVDFEIQARPMNGFSTQWGLSYLHSRNLSSTDAVTHWSDADKVSEWSGFSWNRYDFQTGVLKGLGFALGGTYQGDRLSTTVTTAAPDPLILPWYLRADAAVFYQVNRKLDLALNVQNLGNDKEIVVSGTTGVGLELASPRNYSLRATYHF